LAAKADYSACLVIQDGVTILPAGQPVLSPLALLSSARWPALLTALAADFDRIIIDAPALAAGSDALLLGQPAVTAVVVIRANAVSTGRASAAVAQLVTAQIPVLGGILTQVAEPQLERAENRRHCGAPARGSL
jgi:Mrp family chromosome partitioning ATPase